MAERISKSEKKRRFKHEENAAQELALLSDNDLKKLPVGQSVKNEIINCRGLKGGARKRQIKYLAKVMRDDSVTEVMDFLAAKKGSKLKENRLHHEAERIRDLIITEAIETQQYCLQNSLEWEPDYPGDALAEILSSYEIDEVDLRRTVFQYVRTRVHNHYREVFRIIKAAIEKKELLKSVEGKPD